ncbi:hypothetical protein BAUCODRAFT_317246 [Baudoinia panamericana UAMH 10762]|uniref:Uncharacterized protein n=1 Tax=Baudoinia panamericana (strain UAMH 10762) TaxID=717646 RepID=M2M3P0_BAUPA|nr:uncharacterized protein BAUCODRAFT_317246 [Baudoinia panamericana UAMH 10762]EMC91176.1 hypothetical protein BAUCODRAFT_317246 [Baudoinia panamericana UAMH 10762]
MTGKAKATRAAPTLYDAVAGRVGYEGFHTESRPSERRDTASTSLVPVPADEMLFRRKGAPTRFAEDDLYLADRQLLPSQSLPESDLLKVIHAYVSDAWSPGRNSGHATNPRSMDETALLAMGLLLEEAAIATLGKSGDLAFVESG